MYQVPKVLFLYTEIAEYFLACCRNLVANGMEVYIIRFPLNKEAPFQFAKEQGINLIDKPALSYSDLVTLIDKIAPDSIICSGWVDKDYLAICKRYFKKIPTVLALDNHWNGTLKQRIATLVSPVFILNRFSYCWVPGGKQKKYAQKIGFKEEEIFEGFYSADTNYFWRMYHENIELKRRSFPKRFLYVGRFYEFKGLTDLWRAFIQIQNETPNDWELWCLGTGSLEPVAHPKIKYFGFIQPKEMQKFIKEAGVFVLPSRFEPWAVVIHEFACSGFPIICSTAVGAAETFVKPGENGFIFESNNVESIKRAMKKVITCSENELFGMGQKSHEFSKQITVNSWTQTINQFLSVPC